MRAFAIVSVSLVLLAGSAHGAAKRVRGPFLLIALPALGTVTWRCEVGTGRYALGFRSFRISATDHLVLSASGRVVRRADVQPGDSLALPFLGRAQELALVQGTGAGTLRASVVVRFDEPKVTPYCYAYLPPRVRVSVGPRR